MRKYFIFRKGVSSYGTVLGELESIQDERPARQRGRRVFCMNDYYAALEKVARLV